MNHQKYILSLDIGTTSTRAMIFDAQQHIHAIAQKNIALSLPRPGWAEQDPMEILSYTLEVLEETLNRASLSLKDILSIGITNQRETTILWEKATGRPVYKAINWQCRRTAHICRELESRGLAKTIRSSTGLMLDAYFSATKLMWLLELPGIRAMAERNELLFGTVDTWILWNITGGKVHATDPTNASRTMLFNIHTMDWDESLLSAFSVPKQILPTVLPSSSNFGEANLFGQKVNIGGMAGDQQAALFGQCCFNDGDTKNTYGTGCFLLTNTGKTPIESKEGLITTVALGPDATEAYALEGSVFTCGTLFDWLSNSLGILPTADDAAYFASKVPDTCGVYMVPAFSGLGAPYWDMYARGCLMGLTASTKKEHIIRAAEESIAYQTRDLVRAVEKDTGHHLKELKADGGASRDSFLMQFQSDILAAPVRRPVIRETTSLGAAYLAGLSSGFWANTGEIMQNWKCDSVFSPSMDEHRRKILLLNWHKAVSKSLHWIESDSQND